MWQWKFDALDLEREIRSRSQQNRREMRMKTRAAQARQGGSVAVLPHGMKAHAARWAAPVFWRWPSRRRFGWGLVRGGRNRERGGREAEHGRGGVPSFALRAAAP
eukprot:1055113-Pleurochrysis_carterae.AAC.1